METFLVKFAIRNLTVGGMYMVIRGHTGGPTIDTGD